MDDYFITAKEEVLVEVASIIKADILKYMISKNIDSDDPNNAIAILYEKVCKLSDSLIQKDYTMNELEDVSAQLKFVKEYFAEIEDGQR